MFCQELFHGCQMKDVAGSDFTELGRHLHCGWLTIGDIGYCAKSTAVSTHVLLPLMGVRQISALRRKKTGVLVRSSLNL